MKRIEELKSYIAHVTAWTQAKIAEIEREEAAIARVRDEEIVRVRRDIEQLATRNAELKCAGDEGRCVFSAKLDVVMALVCDFRDAFPRAPIVWDEHLVCHTISVRFTLAASNYHMGGDADPRHLRDLKLELPPGLAYGAQPFIERAARLFLKTPASLEYLKYLCNKHGSDWIEEDDDEPTEENRTFVGTTKLHVLVRKMVAEDECLLPLV